MESVRANNLLDFRQFLLYSSESKTQPKLNFGSLVSNDDTSPKMKTLDASDSRFLREFYSNSRLHHISTLAAEMKRYVSHLREKSQGGGGPQALAGRSALIEWAQERKARGEKSKGQSRLATTKEKKQLVMHIDMDCFFVSVGLRKWVHH